MARTTKETGAQRTESIQVCFFSLGLSTIFKYTSSGPNLNKPSHTKLLPGCESVVSDYSFLVTIVYLLKVKVARARLPGGCTQNCQTLEARSLLTI